MVTAAAILASLAAAAAVNAAPSDPARVAIVFPPWWGAARSASAAASAGDILDMGGLPFIVIVRRGPPASNPSPRPTGALFVMGADPRSLCTSVFRDL